ncbi:MAG: PIN domain-containing protein [Armatimonadota bacterium]
MSVYIDTSAFLAVLDEDDQNHHDAGQVWTDMVNNKESLVTSTYVIVETTALLRKRFGIPAVRRFQMDVMSVVAIEWVDEITHNAGISALLTTGRHGPSLVDCIGFEIVRKLGIERVFAYDKHFRGQGFGL